MNEETKKAIDDSIAHWKRMIEWAKELKGGTPYLNTMHKAIGEVWKSEYCALCESFFRPGLGCTNCPLHLSGNNCLEESSLWENVDNSLTWKEWVRNAKKLLKVLEGLKNERF